MKDFRAYQISKDFYKICADLKLPRHLRDQLDRASASICLNIAEGAGRYSGADQRRFYAIAFGSLRESQAILDLEIKADHEAVAIADRLASHLFRLVHRR